MNERPATPALSGPHKMVPALDGVRGLAILLVLIYHFSLYGGMLPDNAVDAAFKRFTTTGWCGVDLFFVLSGFLITGILFDAKGGDRYFRTFYMRRVLRIFPLYYGFLAAYLIAIAVLAAPGGRSHALLGEQAWYWSYLVNARYAVEGWPEYPILGHFWSLAVEEQFYMVWPFLVFALPRRALMYLCCACFLTALALRVGVAVTDVKDVAAYVLMPCRMDALLAGGFLALFLRGGDAAKSRARSCLPFMVVPAVGVIALYFWRGGLSPRDHVVFTAGFAMLAILFTGMLAWAVLTPETSRAGRFFADSRLRFLGRYSYGIYVYHHVVIFILGNTALAAHKIPRLFGSQIPGQMLIMLVAGAVSIAMALGSWYLFEAPFLRLKRFFEYSSRPPTAAKQEPDDPSSDSEARETESVSGRGDRE